MKKSLMTLTLTIVGLAELCAQSPEAFNYQAIARNAGGDALINQSVGVQFELHQATAGGTVVYAESHSPTTNTHGLFTVAVGEGTPSVGTFSSVDWASGPYFLEVGLDPAGGTSYTSMGTQQLLSVPYALHAGGSIELADADGDTKVQVEESADEDIIRFDVAGNERWVMQGARLESINSGNSVFVGEGAGTNDDLSSNFNTAIGHQALHNNLIGDKSTAVGYRALYSNSTSSRNTAIGYQALISNTNGYYNTATGYQSLLANTTGYHNTATGYESLANNTTGEKNTSNGHQALYNNTTGYFNVADGWSALFNNTIGNANTAIGYESLYSNTWGVANTAVGRSALFSNTSGLVNTAIGRNALFSNTAGFENTASGAAALYFNSTGEKNSAHGFEALHDNTSGSQNSAIGDQALYTNTIGNYNAATGYRALYNNTIGSYNVATGNLAMNNNTSGGFNSACGYQALHDNTTGSWNTALGNQALHNNSTGLRNTAVGHLAFNVGTNYSNSIALGYNAEPNASNTARIGNSSVSVIGGYANWSNVSDGRFKVDVQEKVVGLEFISALRPVTYRLNMDAIADFHNTPDSLRLREAEALKEQEVQVGFIAQEVEAAAKALNFEFHGVDAPKNFSSHYGLRYAEFVVPLVKAVQEQQAIINELKAAVQDKDLQLEKQVQTNTELLEKLQDQLNVLGKM